MRLYIDDNLKESSKKLKIVFIQEKEERLYLEEAILCQGQGGSFIL